MARPLLVRALGPLLLALAMTGMGPTPAHASPRDLPTDGPAALYRPAPTLPRARGWPASDDVFPLTSGTGRLADGAFYWTDYLYDDHGATTAGTGNPAVTAGTPSFGTYRYPGGPAYAANAADIFRTAVALRKDATYWRVDWTTLARRTVPMAVWTFDRDSDTATGETAWPAAAGVSSAGIDTALIVSSHGARLIDVASGHVLGRLRTTVTPAARSFVVRVPRKLLHVHGNWRIRVASGLANADGTALRRPPGTTPAQTSLYNVGFRTHYQENPTNNFWNDRAQTKELDLGRVARFAVVVHWNRLVRRLTTPQRTPTGWNDRWYVSAVDLGHGVKVDAASIEDGEANYLGRVQPYAVYVPARRSAKTRLPLTFLLHSSTQNHNQYAATTPKLVAGACEQRRSLCVSTLGRGPDGNYFGPAELDFWQVWHEVARSFHVDPDRTVLSGYSLGGEGANDLAMAHPDLFARSVTLAGGIGDTPSLANLRWVPTYLAGGAADELVPVPIQRAQANRMRALGFRYRWVVVSAIDHVGYELCDCFDDAVAYMRGARRVTTPDRFTFHWHPRNGHVDNGFGPNLSAVYWTQRPDLGVGTTGAYWVRNLRARTASRDAEVTARSLAVPSRAVTTTHSTAVDPTFQPAPATIDQQTWRLGQVSATRSAITLELSNVRSLRLLMHDAGIPYDAPAVVTITTDGRTTLDIDSTRYRLAAGTHRLRIGGLPPAD